MDSIHGEHSLYCWSVPPDQGNENPYLLVERTWKRIFGGFKALSEHPFSNLRGSRFTIFCGESQNPWKLVIGIDRSAPKDIVSFFSGLMAGVAVPGYPELLTESPLTPHHRYFSGQLKCYRGDAEDIGKQEADERFGTGLAVTFYEVVDSSFLNEPEEYANEG